MTSEVTQAALEPCPLCGSRAFFAPHHAGFPVWCITDRCLRLPPRETKAEAVAAWNTRLTAQSGEGRSGAGEEKPSDNSDPWYQLGWYKDRLERAEIERDEWKDRAMSSRLSALNARQSGEGEREALREALAEAYRKGATDVHNYWVNNPGEPPRGDPEFGESASDYAAAALDIFDSAAALRATDDAGGAK